MIDTIQRVCRLLSATGATPIEVARQLGQVVEGGAGDHEIVVRPTNSAVGSATVVARIDAPETDFVALEPAPGARLTVSQLTAALGPYREGPRTRPLAPRRIVFRPEVRGPTHTCAVTADVSPEPGAVDDRTVDLVIVRRDPIVR